MKRFLTFFIIIFFIEGFGQNLEMDTELIELNFQYSSDPTDFFHFQNQLFFRGKYKGIDDYSIFKYDGIDAVIMKNGGGERLICGVPIIGDNLLYFSGKIYDDFYGDHYLWVSNGEGNDAIPLIESGGNYELLLTIGSRLFFLYSDPFGKKLWTSNGTPETTIQLMDLHTAPQNAGYVKNVIESQGKLFFSTDDPTYGEELWVSDGTVNGTYMVKDIHEGVQSSRITSIISFNEKIYFVAIDGVNGYELWTSDGTESGTYILKNINPGNSHAFSQLSNQFIEFDGNFYFFANDGTNIQLWKSNGTTNGTTLFKNVNTFPNNYSYQTASINGAATDDFFVFKAYDYNSSNYQYTEKLMKSDGTIEGTLELLELNSNYSPFSDSQLDRIQNKIYFTTESTYPNKELWVTDGTSQGTNFVTDGYQEFSYFKSEGNNLFLKAKISHNEFQVLKVDYNSNSSSIFLENTINPERGFEIFNGEIYFGFDFNYFNNYHPSGSELWKSNLAGNNPILVEDINTAAPAYPTNFANFFNGSTVFNANNYLSYGLYSISTSNELTFLGESYMFQGDGYDSEFYRVGDYYYFNVDSSALNYDLTGLCRTDGTAEGTIKVGNVHVADHMKYNRNYFTHLNDDLYFIAIDGEAYSSKSKIWRTNATNNQTNILVDFTENSNNYTVFNSVIEFNNKIYFAGGIFEPPFHDIVLKGLWSYNPIGENTELIYEPEMTYWDDTGRIEIIGINEGILYFYNIQRTSGNTVTTHFYSLDSEDNIALLGSFNGRVLNSFYYNKFIISNGYFYLPFSDLNINKIKLIELGLNHISLLTVEDSNSSTDINSIMSCGNNLYFLETSNYGLWSMSNENEFTLLNGEFDVEAISDLNCYKNELLLYAKTFYPENAVDHSELIVTNGNIEDTHEIIINVDSDFDQIKIEDIFIDNQNKIFLSLSDHYTGAELYVSELDIILTTEEINEGLTKDNSNVLIYPNPTSSEINVVTNDQSQIKQIQLYDLTGKLMEIGIYNAEEVKLNLNKYNSGIYLLKVQTEKNTTTKKVILK